MIKTMSVEFIRVEIIKKIVTYVHRFQQMDEHMERFRLGGFRGGYAR